MKKLPLHAWHQLRGAKAGEYAGFTMPLYYSQPLAEHKAVRDRAGVFDISHMGQFVCTGEKATAMLQYALANDVKSIGDGQALYSPLCKQDGGVLDDLIIYRYSPDRYRIIVNADTRQKDFNWLTALAGMFGVELSDLSAGQCLFAIQGPQAMALLAPHCGADPANLKFFGFMETTLFGANVFMARTGYTGEPGVEVSVALEDGLGVWESITEKLAIPPIGLVARDTLRLEPGYSLYGHELKEEWSPLESGIGWAVRLDVDDDFIGKEALFSLTGRGTDYLRAGLELIERGIPRADYPVTDGQQQVGIVTSGALSPTTGKSIALIRVQAPLAKPGTRLFVDIRGKPVEAVVVKLPFYVNPALRK
ncbi:MAG: glycine cleavage system aminomethyltransferase GcvT [Deltaproteobacteria bacterium]|nr:glycine cleavage system aminomethyltransferase GcvT [Deltaproteobacteria bacterium]